MHFITSSATPNTSNKNKQSDNTICSNKKLTGLNYSSHNSANSTSSTASSSSSLASQDHKVIKTNKNKINNKNKGNSNSNATDLHKYPTMSNYTDTRQNKKV